MKLEESLQKFHTLLNPVNILPVAIYAQGVFHLNTWKMKSVGITTQRRVCFGPSNRFQGGLQHKLLVQGKQIVLQYPNNDLAMHVKGRAPRTLQQPK